MIVGRSVGRDCEVVLTVASIDQLYFTLIGPALKGSGKSNALCPQSPILFAILSTYFARLPHTSDGVLTALLSI